MLAESAVHLFEFLTVGEQQAIVQYARLQGLQKDGGFFVEDILVEKGGNQTVQKASVARMTRGALVYNYARSKWEVGGEGSDIPDVMVQIFSKAVAAANKAIPLVKDKFVAAQDIGASASAASQELAGIPEDTELNEWSTAEAKSQAWRGPQGTKTTSHHKELIQ